MTHSFPIIFHMQLPSELSRLGVSVTTPKTGYKSVEHTYNICCIQSEFAIITSYVQPPMVEINTFV